MQADAAIPREHIATTLGTAHLHPATAASLHRQGLRTAEDFLDLSGEIISGHPDRHVMCVQIGAIRGLLKREHRVPWKDRFRNWRHGFGWVSKSTREAVILNQLETTGLPAPRLLAHGESGGRAFLLVEEVADAIELRRFLRQESDPVQRAELAEQMGRTLADLHEAGFDHPDLYAKHWLIHPEQGTLTLLDWQRTQRLDHVSWPRRVRAFAALHASLTDDLVTPRERLRLMWAYLRVVRRSGSAPRFSTFIKRIERESRRLLDRRGIREQRQPPIAPTAQRLVWLDGEACCAIPEVANDLRSPVMRDLVTDSSANGATVHLSSGVVGELQNRSYCSPWSLWWSRLRGKSWRSPELKQARLLFHLQRYHIPAPRLLAFGQRINGLIHGNAFLLTEAIGQCRSLTEAIRSADALESARWCRELGLLLDRLHEAGCLLKSLDTLVVRGGGDASQEEGPRQNPSPEVEKVADSMRQNPSPAPSPKAGGEPTAAGYHTEDARPRTRKVHRIDPPPTLGEGTGERFLPHRIAPPPALGEGSGEGFCLIESGGGSSPESELILRDVHDIDFRRFLRPRLRHRELARLWKQCRTWMSRTAGLRVLKAYLGLARLTPDAKALAHRIEEASR